MAVPISTSRPDKERARRAKEARLAAAALAEQQAPAQAVPPPPSSAGSHQQHPPPQAAYAPHAPSPASSYASHSTIPAPHQLQQGGGPYAQAAVARTSLNVPSPQAGYGRPVSPQQYGAPVQAAAPTASPRTSGGRPLSSGPPRSALMQAPQMLHSASQGSMPMSAAYNVDPPIASFGQPQSVQQVQHAHQHPPHPVQKDQPLPGPPAPNRTPGYPTADAYQSVPGPAVPPAFSPSAYSTPCGDSRRHTWGTLGSSDSASQLGHYAAASTYGAPPPSNAVAGPSSTTSTRGLGGVAPVMSAKRSAESLISYVRHVRQALFHRPSTDQYLLRTIDVFSTNIMGHVQRLIAREMELTGEENRALSSISRDFETAARWLQDHQQDIAVNWPPDRSVKALKEMDERLTKAFTSKLAVALYEAVQDTRQLSLQISRQLDGLDGLVSDLPGMIRRVMAQANSSEIDATISRLRVEEDALKPANGAQSGYGGGEAEKTIQSLLDALEALRLSQSEKEARAVAEQRLLNNNGHVAAITPATVTTSAYRQDPDQSSLRSLQSETELSYNLASPGPGGLAYQPAHSLAQVAKAAEGWSDDKKAPLDDGGIYFQPVDPLTKTELIDPVLADDGCIHDRFSITNHKPDNPLQPGQPLRILGDVLQLRKAIFAKFPERKDECFERRANFLETTIKEYDEAGVSFLDVVEMLDKLSTVLAWQNGEEDCGVLVRRGILRWRLRNLAGARADLLLALKLSPTLPIHHLLAVVHLELRDHAAALAAVEQALARDGRDSIACAVRSQIHSFFGRIGAATRDAEAASAAIREGDLRTQQQNSRVSKTTYSPHPHRTVPDTPLPELLDLPNLFAGFAWLSLGEPIRASNHIAQSVDRGVLGDPWPRCLWGYILTVSSEDETARQEGLRELEASWKLSGDIWKRSDDDGGLPSSARPLQASIGILLAQAKAAGVDKLGAKAILVASLKQQHPLQARTSEEVALLASLHADTDDYEGASAAFDEAIYLASKSGRMDERAALLAERTRRGAL